MRLLTYTASGGERRAGFLQATSGNDAAAPVRAADLARTAAALGLPPLPASLDALLAEGDALSALQRLDAALRHSSLPLPADCLLPAKAQLCVPFDRPPRNILCVGANYADHVQELGQAFAFTQGACPTIFTKPATALAAPDTTLPLPATVSREFDYEVELAVIIGKGGANIPVERALEHVFGYCVFNDVTARDIQRTSSQWYAGKGVDKSSPLGPYIVTADALPDPQQSRITCRVNGELRQDSHTSRMIFSVAQIIHALSARGSALLAGDIIATGTPSGVGMSRHPPCWLRRGDRLELEITGVGVQTSVIA